MRAIFGRGVGNNVTQTDALQVNEAPELLTARERLGAMLRFMPNLVGLCGRLIADARVSKTDKALFASAILYALAPLDLMLDLLPFIGQVDDAYLIALTLLRMIDHADESVVREHWRGDGDPVLLARSLAGLAPMLLPRRISRVLSARIELAPLFKPAPRGREAAVLIDHNADDGTKALLRTAKRKMKCEEDRGVEADNTRKPTAVASDPVTADNDLLAAGASEGLSPDNPSDYRPDYRLPAR